MTEPTVPETPGTEPPGTATRGTATPETPAPGDGGAAGGLVLKLEGARPETVPQKYWDAEAGGVNVQAILENERGLMQKVTDLTASRVPKDGYRLNMPDHLKGLGFDEEDPLFQAAAGFAKERNLDQEGMDALVGAYYSMLPSPEAIADGLKPEWGDRTVNEIKANTDWLDARFDGEVRQSLTALELHPGGQKALKALREAMAGPTPIQERDGGGAGGGLSEAKLEEMKQDPRYWDPNRRDESYVRQVREGYEKLFPD